MRIKLEKPKVPEKYEPITLVLETEEEYRTVRAALSRYSTHNIHGNSSWGHKARSLYHRMNEYAFGTTIAVDNHLKADF